MRLKDLNEGGAKGAKNVDKKKKKGCCSKKDKSIEIKRNIKMKYKEFGKKRRSHRMKKICKNIVVGSINFLLSYALIVCNE